MTNSNSSNSASLIGATWIPLALSITSAAKLFASASPNPQQTILPLENTKISPSLPSLPHLGTHHDSWSAWARAGRSGCVRRRARIYRSAVARVKTGLITPRVGVGFERMGSEAEADRRSGVISLGLAFASDSGFSKCVWEEDLPVEWYLQLYMPLQLRRAKYLWHVVLWRTNINASKKDWRSYLAANPRLTDSNTVEHLNQVN